MTTTTQTSVATEQRSGASQRASRIRFTVDEYVRMSQADVFDGRRVELVAGRILKMNAQANAHRWAVTKCSIAFQSRFAPDRFWVVMPGTLFINRFSAPDPDLHVLAIPGGTPDALLPKPFIVVEISDSTYRRDTGAKLRMYAAAGIQDYWVLNLQQHAVEVYRDPHNPSATPTTNGWTYRSKSIHQAGDSIALLAYPEITVAVTEMLP